VAPRVAILMGSRSDLEVMQHAAETLRSFGLGYEMRVISAHRTPDRLRAFVARAERNGIDAIIAGAGAAAHLAGVTASLTLLPVLGVPLEGSALRGMDALLATVQMPGGIPVGTLAIGKAGAINAALLAIAFFARQEPRLRERLAAYRAARAAEVPDEPL
jgi:5-(carboxyamino)imidazole ribonucleotide mutase